MLSSTYLEVLRKISTILQTSHVQWVITGSVGFALHGLPVEPHDLDLQTDEAGAYEMERLLSDYVTSPVVLTSARNIRAYLGELNIDGIKVEILGNIQNAVSEAEGLWTSPVEIQGHRQLVHIEELFLPVCSLEYAYYVCLTVGRQEKAEMLKQWISQKKSVLQ